MENSLSLVMPVRDGRLDPTDGQKQAIGYFLRDKGSKPVMVKLSKPKVIRSIRANALYWGVFLPPIAAQTGHTTEEIHGFLKDQFLPKVFVKIGAREVEIRKTTTELSTDEFSAYLEQIRAWAAQELGLALPT